MRSALVRAAIKLGRPPGRLSWPEKESCRISEGKGKMALRVKIKSYTIRRTKGKIRRSFGLTPWGRFDCAGGER